MIEDAAPDRDRVRVPCVATIRNARDRAVRAGRMIESLLPDIVGSGSVVTVAFRARVHELSDAKSFAAPLVAEKLHSMAVWLRALFAVVELQSPAAWEAGPWFATLVHETEWLASIDTARVAEAYAAARQRANRARREAERAKRIAAENEIQRDAA